MYAHLFTGKGEMFYLERVYTHIDRRLSSGLVYGLYTTKRSRHYSIGLSIIAMGTLHLKRDVRERLPG